ncbi:MAG: phosphate acetyltransferase [Bacteroidales bacterium]|nr:phosphate acetyltransferase [Bacteroidales bacterium]
MITRLEELVSQVKATGRKYRIAVAWAQDANTIGALRQAFDDGFAVPVMIGIKSEIERVAGEAGISVNGFEIIETKGEKEAAAMAVSLTKSGMADVVMKGLIGTDKFLRAVMDKENGILPAGAIMSYVCAIELPARKKLLFITDPAVIPFPDLDQKVAMANYAIAMANRFGIKKPAVALIGASEKVSRTFTNSIDYSVMCKMADRGQIKNCIMDGPLDIFLACDPESIAIKGVDTPVNGEADILLFPDIESCNPFYKGLMLFGGGELAGVICGTAKPVVVMSRSESEKSKYYCIALSCLMA